MRRTTLIALFAGACFAPEPARAQAKVRAARELAEMLIGRHGATAGRSVSQLTGRIEGLAARHGAEAVVAVKPAVSVVTTAMWCGVAGVCALIAAAAAVLIRHGPPSPEAVKLAVELVRKK